MSALRALLVRRCGLALTLLGLALAMRAVVPLGWMPDTGHGSISIRLCSSGGALQLPLGHGSDRHHEHEHQHDQQPCAFGGLAAAAAAAPPAAPAELPPVVVAALPSVSEEAPAALGRFTPRKPPARAPPLLA